MSIQVPGQYLAILKASYDYTPQSDDEIAIKLDQQLLLVERVDEEFVILFALWNLPWLISSSWWKVKVTGNDEAAENQIGLVPAAYVEQVHFITSVGILLNLTGCPYIYRESFVRLRGSGSRRTHGPRERYLT